MKPDTPGYLLGLDIGSTAIKAGLFDLEGNEIATAAGDAEIFTPHPGWYERRMEDIWSAAVAAIRGVLEKSGIPGDQIHGLAATGHGNGLHLVDPEGKPLYHAIEGADARAADYVKKWQDDGTCDRLLPKTAQCLWPAQPPALLAWMRDNEPEILARAKWLFMVKDYVRFMLTGEAHAEVTDMSGTNIFNVRDVCYDDEIFAAYGLGDMAPLFPPLKNSDELCGSVTAEAAAATGLAAGTPVAGGMFDIDAAAIATGVTDPSQLNVIVGTWSNNQYISPKPVASPELFMTSVFSIPGYWLVLEGSATSASNLEWFLSGFVEGEKGSALYQACDEAVAGTDPEKSSIVFLPFLYQSNLEPDARSAFVGMQGYHNRADMLRAVYEGIVFSHRTHIEKLMKFRDPAESIRITGGAARSKVWMQMFADILQTPIEIPESTELGALGAAICAGVGTGLFDSFHTAADQMVKVSGRIEPDPAKATDYDQKYARYRQIAEALAPVWQSFS
jgi:L-xylulokinase